MGKMTSACLLVSTVMLLVTFGKGMGVLRGGDASSHLTWALVTLVAVLGANVFAMFHATQSDRIIRRLRAELAERDGQPSQD